MKTSQQSLSISLLSQPGNNHEPSSPHFRSTPLFTALSKRVRACVSLSPRRRIAGKLTPRRRVYPAATNSFRVGIYAWAYIFAIRTLITVGARAKLQGGTPGSQEATGSVQPSYRTLCRSLSSLFSSLSCGYAG